MTQDVYMGRRAVDSQAALALEAALRGASREEAARRCWSLIKDQDDAKNENRGKRTLDLDRRRW